VSVDVTIYRTVEDVAPFAQVWTDLAQRGPVYELPLESLLHAIRQPDADFRFIALAQSGEIEALACLFLWQGERTIWLSQLRLFSLKVPMAGLFGGTIAGSLDEKAGQALLAAILAEPKAGLIDLGDTPIDGGLYRAARALGMGQSVHDNPRGATRRALPLTDGIAPYLASLRPSTRKAVLRDCRMFERLSPSFRSFSTPDEVESFLRDAAPLSQRTHQVKLGVKLEDDEAHRARFRALAVAGRLRACIAYVDGTPCAFAWGDLSHRTLYFRMTGYDPEMRRHCAGTAILFHLLETLGADPACGFFDFGVRDMDYKARFGTIVVPSTALSIARWSSPAACFALTIERMMDGLKDKGAALLGGATLARIRRAMRR